MLWIIFCPIFFLHLAIVLSILLRHMVSGYLFGNFKPFFHILIFSKTMVPNRTKLECDTPWMIVFQIRSVTLLCIQDVCYGFWLNIGKHKTYSLSRTTWWNETTFGPNSPCVVSFHKGDRCLRQVPTWPPGRIMQLGSISLSFYHLI